MKNKTLSLLAAVVLSSGCLSNKHSQKLGSDPVTVTLKVVNDEISGEFDIDMTTIKCTDIEDEADNADLVGHLKADDFFGVEEFNTANFVITSSEKGEREGSYMIKGDLTIKGQTNPIQFPASIVAGEDGTTVSAAFAFDRTQFGIEYGSKSLMDAAAGKFIYDEIEIAIDWKM